MAIPRRQKQLSPMAQKALEDLKYEVAQELGYVDLKPGEDPASAFQRALDQKKYETARELGISLTDGYNGHLTTREAGAIGGRLGGYIGGHMVRQMVQYAEENMATKFRK